MGKYKELCHALIDAQYVLVSVHQFLTRRSNGKMAVIRHDVDRKPENAMNMAELEHTLGIHSTYYFRYPCTFRPEVITRISSLGHEIGYHYEVLAKMKGNHSEAIKLFARELQLLRNVSEVRTICMHGSPLSRYDNRDLWKRYDFKEYGIDGEAYLSMNGKGLHYLSDTGRSWNGRHSVRDTIPDAESAPVETTDELIGWIESAEEDIYLTVHPERWAISEMERIFSSAKDELMNVGKKSISTLLGVSK